MRIVYTLSEAKQRFRWLIFLIMGVMGCVLLRLAYLQIYCGSQYSRDAQRQVAYNDKQGNPRGRILDRNGEELAVSIMCESLYIDSSQILNQEKKSAGDGNLVQFTAELLAPVLKINQDDIVDKIEHTLKTFPFKFK